MTDEWVSLGHIARAHGIKGGVRLHLWNDESETLRAGLELELRRERGAPIRTKVKRIYGDGLVELDAIPDRNAAEAWKGAELFVRRADFPALDDDEAYLEDLVGAALCDETGAVRGVVRGFVAESPQTLAEVAVEGSKEPMLVPLVEELIVRIEAGDPPRIVMRLPVGLLDPENAT